MYAPLITPIVRNFLIWGAKTYVKIVNLVAIIRRYARNSTTIQPYDADFRCQVKNQSTPVRQKGRRAPGAKISLTLRRIYSDLTALNCTLVSTG